MSAVNKSTLGELQLEYGATKLFAGVYNTLHRGLGYLSIPCFAISIGCGISTVVITGFNIMSADPKTIMFGSSVLLLQSLQKYVRIGTFASVSAYLSGLFSLRMSNVFKTLEEDADYRMMVLANKANALN